MAELNEWQKYLEPYIEIYQNLLREIYDSITDFRVGCGNPRLITPKEKDFLLIQFYPSLQNNLHHFLPYEQARDIRQIIYDAHNVLSPLTDAASYEKYRDDSLLFEQDIEITLLNAYNAARKILEVHTAPEQTEASGGEKKIQKIEGEWSKPMSKVDIMNRLGFGLRGYRKLETFAKEHPIY
jgi:hypothetical protein